VPVASGRQEKWWSAIDINIVVDLDGPGSVTAPTVKKKKEASSSHFLFSLEDDDGDGADNALDFSAFDRR
jgi:hypothetical protein